MNKFLEATPTTKYWYMKPEEVVDLIMEDCGMWIRESKGNLIYRGMTMEAGRPPMVKKTVRKGRKPLDTPQQAHNAIVDLLRSMGFKANRDNSIFTSGSISQASGYGETHVVFPISHYDYTWGPDVNDLYRRITNGHLISLFYVLPNRLRMEYDKQPKSEMPGMNINRKRDFYLDAMNANKGKFNLETMFHDFGHKFSNKDLPKAIEANVEIMISTTFYYALSLAYWQTIKDEFYSRLGRI